MGNSASSSGRGHHDDTVDFGSLHPQGVYTGPKDWNQAIVSQLIGSRRIAPFYRPLEDYEESWTDEQILAARKELPPASESNAAEGNSRVETSSIHSKSSSIKRSTVKEPPKSEAWIYRGAVECPICFLYYPPNINHSRCCDQAICTECFVQIKRAEPTTTHLVSEPAACPYCVQENFGVVYTPPPWRAGLGSDNSSSPFSDSPKGAQTPDGRPPYPTHKRRQKSFGPDSPEVVTTDQIRPDWEAKLAAVRAAVTRRANRRIIMRQVGDRLIPVGVTSGRVHAMPGEDGQSDGSEQSGSSSRRRRRQQQQQQGSGLEQLLGGMGGPDLEELMMMEAMRLSLIEHEAQQKKEAEEKRKQEEEAAKLGRSEADSSAQTSSSSSEAASSTNPQPTPVTDRPSSQEAASSQPSSAQNTNPRQTSPRPFSTLNAVLSTTSTASAILRQSERPTLDNDSSDSTANSTTSVANSAADTTPITKDTPSTADSGSANPSVSQPAASSSSEPLPVPRPATLDRLDSVATSVNSEVGPSSYDALPSSPESSASIANEPLIGSKPVDDTPGTPRAHESQDYFTDARTEADTGKPSASQS